MTTVRKWIMGGPMVREEQTEMPADSLTTGCANRHVGHPLIFIELLSEQLLQTSRRYNSSENPTVTPSCRLETCSTRHRRIFRNVRTRSMCERQGSTVSVLAGFYAGVRHGVA